MACSMSHENAIWPAASRIYVFEPYPGSPIPVVCAQCVDHPCVDSCSFNALYIDDNTGAVLVRAENCTLCGACRAACLLSIPRIIPGKNYVLICDLCGGSPKCVEACSSVGYNAIKVVKKPEDVVSSAYLRDPYEVSKRVFERLIASR